MSDAAMPLFKKEHVVAVYFDLEKAYDTILHGDTPF